MGSPLQGTHRQLFGRFKFLVDIDGFTSAAFQSATGLKFNIAVMEYWEGGTLAAYKEPGRATFDNLTMERGVSYDLDFYTWIIDVIDMLASLPEGSGQISPGFKKNLRVWQQERDNSISVSYPVTAAFPTEWNASEWDNTSDEVSIESITLSYRYFTKENIGSPAA